MTRETLSRFGLQFAIGLLLLFPTTVLLNQLEVTTGVQVEGFSRGIVILVVCVWLPMAFLRFYEVRRRA
jgi:hypothetical protein